MNLLKEYVDSRYEEWEKKIFEHYCGPEQAVVENLIDEAKKNDVELDEIPFKTPVDDFIKATWEQENSRPFPEEPDIDTDSKEKMMEFIKFQREELSKHVERVFTPEIQLDQISIQKEEDSKALFESLLKKFNEIVIIKSTMNGCNRATILQTPRLSIMPDVFGLKILIHTMIFRHKEE